MRLAYVNACRFGRRCQGHGRMRAAPPRAVPQTRTQYRTFYFYKFHAERSCILLSGTQMHFELVICNFGHEMVLLFIAFAAHEESLLVLRLMNHAKILEFWWHIIKTKSNKTTTTLFHYITFSVIDGYFKRKLVVKVIMFYGCR